tara:strand:- start:2160 stop:3161 length:1002 start_codon:yes stop_codon:yes gene_type:complete
MADIRVDKVLVGSPTYKVVVGDYTRVMKVEVGSPTRNVFISNTTLLDDVIGIETNNNQNGDLLIYNSTTGDFENSNELVNNQVIDGKIYPVDSDRGYILVRRSPTTGVPTSLRAGEIAYSYLADAGSSVDGIGNGGDRIYLGIGSDETEFATRIDIIGGKYFTDLLTHAHGTLTASSAIVVGADKSINELITDILTVNTYALIDSARVTNDLHVDGTLYVNFVDSVSTNNLTALSITSNNANFDSATVGGDVTVNGTLHVNNIDDSDLISNLEGRILGGQGITIDIDSGVSTLTINATIADSDTLGVVKFNRDQFVVDSTGTVTLYAVNGGSF